MITNTELVADNSQSVWRLPPFWTEDPTVWFAVAESHFDMWNITNSSRKFSFVVAALPKPIAVRARDLFLHPHPVEPYEQFKLALIKQLTESDKIRLERPTCSQLIQNRKPSEVFRRLKHTLRDSLDESVLRSLFMNHLSPSVRNILSSVETLPVAKLASLADILTNNVQVATGSGNSTEEVTRELCRQIETLNDNIRQILLLNRSNPTSCSPCPEPVPVSHSRFDQVHLSIVGPFPQSDGFAFILTCMDSLTGWPEAAAMKNAKLKTTFSTFVWCWISRFGVPSTVTALKCSQFESKSCWKLFHDLGINYCRAKASDQSARNMKQLELKIREAIREQECGSKWFEALPRILTQIRATGNTGFVHSPSENVSKMDDFSSMI